MVIFTDFSTLLARTLTITVLALAFLFASLRKNGEANLPKYCGYGLIFLYTCYAISGISFGNGVSIWAELIFAAYFAIFVFSFYFGVGLSRFQFVLICREPSQEIKKRLINPVNKKFIFFSCVLFFLYLSILTEGNPLKILTQATELKHYRLNLILVERNFILFFLESLVISIITIGLVWSIIGHKDDKAADFAFRVFIVLVLLQIFSTGARSPLIGFFLIFLVALLEGRKYSRKMEKLFISIKRYIFIIILIGFSYMAWTTSSRKEFEGLAIAVFQDYFDIVDFGYVSPLLNGDSGTSFLLGTVIVYAAATFNNFVLRFQLTSTIDHTFGYQFLFPYANFFESITRNFTDAFSSWRELSSENNKILTNMADAATQWSTLFGDFLWDFDIFGSVIAISIFSVLLGYMVGAARRRPTTSKNILKVILVGTLIMPLINPFSSLQFHIICILLLGLKFVFDYPSKLHSNRF